MKITEDYLSGMDCTLIFKNGDKIVGLTTNGYIRDKFLVNEEDQDRLFDYFEDSEHKSEFTIVQGMKKIYPVIDSFTELAESGLYAYDMHNNVETLVAIPKTPLLVSDLPEEIQSILPSFIEKPINRNKKGIFKK